MEGIHGNRLFALPHEELRKALAKYNRLGKQSLAERRKP
jgi:hypothetical protein